MRYRQRKYSRVMNVMARVYAIALSLLKKQKIYGTS